MSFMFMNGTAECAFVLGLLPTNAGHPVTWGSWLKAAFPLGIIFFFLSYLTIIFLYRPKKSTELNADVIEAQIKTLGPMSGKEMISLFTIILSVVGFATEPWHHVDEAWIAMLAFLIVFATSVIDEQAIRTDIDWSFLIALGAMVGFGDILTESGLAAMIVSVIKPYLEIFSNSKVLFLMAFSMVVHLLRFALPLSPGLLVSMLAIMPILSSIGIDPLVSGLVALISSNPWVLRQQNSIYRAVWKATGGKIFNHEDTLGMALLHMVIVAVAVGLSVPYWEYLGLIR
jgi:di/tricarboxylate transporter